MRSLVLTLSFVVLAQPAWAQWTPITEIPATPMLSVWVNGDTIAASGDTAVYVSTNNGATWKSSSKVPGDAVEVERVRMHDGRLYAATRGAGVFVSDDLGDTWTDFNQGLVGGFNNAQMFVLDALLMGDSLYLATDGAPGPWVRNLRAGTWTPFGGNTLQAFSATNVSAIAAGGSRLLIGGGFNGSAFFRDPGDSDWKLSLLENDHFLPGLAILTAFWTGDRWLVGANNGVFWSATGEPPWTFSDVGPGPWFLASFVKHGQIVFANFEAFASEIVLSQDDGATWQLFEDFPGTPVIQLALSGDILYAARADGLWRRSLASVSAEARRPSTLRFSLTSSQPVRDDTRFAFDLPEAGHAVIEVFNLAGRRISIPLDAALPAGRHEIAWSTRDLPSGIYYARLRIGPQAETLRLVRVH